MALRCPNDHPVLESYAYCPYCMVRLHPPDEPEAAVPPVPPTDEVERALPGQNAPVSGPAGPGIEPAPPSGPAVGVAPAPRPDRRLRRWAPAGAALCVAAVVGAALARGGGADPVPAGRAVPSAPTTSVPATSAPSDPMTTDAPTTTLGPVALGDACDPATAPPGPVDSTAGVDARCVPEVWGDPAARHAWWPVDTPVNGEWELRDRSCRIGAEVVVAGGTLVSHSDRTRDITIVVEFVSERGAVVGTGGSAVRDVDPGTSRAWEAGYLGPASAEVRECRIAEVRYRA